MRRSFHAIVLDLLDRLTGARTAAEVEVERVRTVEDAAAWQRYEAWRTERVQRGEPVAPSAEVIPFPGALDRAEGRP